MEEGFFRSATPQEHEAVVKNEEKQKSINLVASKKHKEKILQGDYAVQTVMVMGRDSAGMGNRISRYTFISEDGMIYIANIQNSYVKDMQDKDIGLLVMINEEETDNPIDEYRFIPVAEYDPDYRQRAGAFSLKGTKPLFDPRKNKLDPKYNKINFAKEIRREQNSDADYRFAAGKARIDSRLNKLGTRYADDLSDLDSDYADHEEGTVYEFKRPTDKQHASVISYYKPKLAFDMTVFIMTALSFVIGYSMLFAVFTFGEVVPANFVLVSYILIFLALASIFFRGIKLIPSSDYALVVMIVIGFSLNAFTIGIPLAGAPALIVQCYAAAGLLINLVLAVNFHLDSLVLCNRILKKEYVVAEGVVIDKSKRSEGGYRSRWMNYKVEVRTRNGSTIPIEWISRRQYKECSTASDVLLVIPDKIKWQDSVNTRLVVLPFGHD